MFQPRDIHSLSGFEEMEYVGMEGMCYRCHEIFWIAVDNLYQAGDCPKCHGYVSIPDRLARWNSEARIYKLHQEHCKM